MVFLSKNALTDCSVRAFTIRLLSIQAVLSQASLSCFLQTSLSSSHQLEYDNFGVFHIQQHPIKSKFYWVQVLIICSIQGFRTVLTEEYKKRPHTENCARSLVIYAVLVSDRINVFTKKTLNHVATKHSASTLWFNYIINER